MIERDKLSRDLVYVLTKDVTNPHPDRRYKSDIAAVPVIKAGTKLIAWVGNDASPSPRLEPMEGQGLNGSVVLFMDEQKELFGLMMGAMEVAPDDLATLLGFFKRSCTYSSDMLLMLVHTGKITLDDLRAAAAMYEALDEEQVNNVSAQHGYSN